MFIFTQRVNKTLHSDIVKLCWYTVQNYIYIRGLNSSIFANEHKCNE